MSYALPSITRVPAAEKGLTIADFLVPVRVGERVSPRLRNIALVVAGSLLIYLTAEPFEYPRSDWPPNIRLVGPCDWDPPAEPPQWLAQTAQPIVLVTTSSEFQEIGRAHV